MTNLERRFTAGRVELRLSSEKRTFGGYAAKFETQSKNLGGFVETITRGFFNRSAGRGFPGVLARYNHDDNMLLGTTDARTLRLNIDEIGLLYEVDPPASRADVTELVERGDVNRSSFAFRTVEDDWALNDSGVPLRSLVEGQLIDVAPVNVPAYDDTSVAMRSIDGAYSSLANKFDASLEEVRKMAASDELRRFFKRTDKQEKRAMSAAYALALVKDIK